MPDRLQDGEIELLDTLERGRFSGFEWLFEHRRAGLRRVGERPLEVGLVDLDPGVSKTETVDTRPRRMGTNERVPEVEEGDLGLSERVRGRHATSLSMVRPH